MLFMGAKAMGLGEGAAKVAMLITHPGEKEKTEARAWPLLFFSLFLSFFLSFFFPVYYLIKY